MSKTSKKNRDTKQEFLLTFFEDYEGYEEKEVNGFWLVKMRNFDKWIVAIFTKESFKNYAGRQSNSLLDELDKEFENKIDAD